MYSVDVCCLQETKIKDLNNYGINGSTVIAFHSDNKHYGNGFVIVKKQKNSIHKYWKVSDRICVLLLQLKTNLAGKDALYKSEPINDTRIKISELTTKENYKVEKVSDTKLNFEKVNPKAKHIISMINVYGPISERAKKFPGVIQKVYNDINKPYK